MRSMCLKKWFTVLMLFCVAGATSAEDPYTYLRKLRFSSGIEIDTHTGSITYSGLSTDTAARQFWRDIERAWPGIVRVTCPQCRTEFCPKSAKRKPSAGLRDTTWARLPLERFVVEE